VARIVDIPEHGTGYVQGGGVGLLGGCVWTRRNEVGPGLREDTRTAERVAGPSRLDGKEGEIVRFLELGVLKSTIAKITDVSRPTIRRRQQAQIGMRFVHTAPGSTNAG